MHYACSVGHGQVRAATLSTVLLVERELKLLKNIYLVYLYMLFMITCIDKAHLALLSMYKICPTKICCAAPNFPQHPFLHIHLFTCIHASAPYTVGYTL